VGDEKRTGTIIAAWQKTVPGSIDSVFTSAGIGRPMIDITAICIAAARSTKNIIVREDARAMSAEHYAKAQRAEHRPPAHGAYPR